MAAMQLRRIGDRYLRVSWFPRPIVVSPLIVVRQLWPTLVLNGGFFGQPGEQRTIRHQFGIWADG